MNFVELRACRRKDPTVCELAIRRDAIKPAGRRRGKTQRRANRETTLEDERVHVANESLWIYHGETQGDDLARPAINAGDLRTCKPRFNVVASFFPFRTRNSATMSRIIAVLIIFFFYRLSRFSCLSSACGSPNVSYCVRSVSCTFVFGCWTVRFVLLDSTRRISPSSTAFHSHSSALRLVTFHSDSFCRTRDSSPFSHVETMLVVLFAALVTIW